MSETTGQPVVGPVNALSFVPEASGAWSPNEKDIPRKSIEGWAVFLDAEGRVCSWYRFLDRPEFEWARAHFENSLVSLLDFPMSSAKWGFLGRAVDALHSLERTEGIRNPIVLEVGSGVGENFWIIERYLRDMGSAIVPRFIGIECDPVLASCANVLTSSTSRMRTFLAEATELGRFSDKSIDLVLSHTGLNYMAGDAHGVLADMVRISRFAVVADHFMTDLAQDMYATFVTGHRFCIPSESRFASIVRADPSMRYIDCGRSRLHMDVNAQGQAECFFERPPATDLFWAKNLIVNPSLLKGLDETALQAISR